MTERPRRAYATYVLGIIALIAFFNYMHRLLPSVLVEPIKADLGLSDTEIGLLFGLAFALFYAVMGIPLARLADAKPRVALLSIVMTLWCAATALCGIAQNFVQLFLARMMVGIGEAGSMPASYSLIGDYFPPKSRSVAMGIFQAGGAVGVAVGLLLAGVIAELYGWRWTVIVLGAPGVFVALVTWLTVREPTRGTFDSETTRTAPARNLIAACGLLFRRRTYMHICIAITLSLFSLNGLVYWVPAFFIRLHDMSLADVGFWSAVTFGLGNAAGMFVSGFVVRPLMERDSRWELWFAGLAYGMSAPLYLAAFLALDTTLSISFMCLATFVAAMGLPPGMSALQRVVESDLRATAIGIITFIAAIVSQGFAVFLIGYLSDILAPTLLESSLKVALSITLIFPAWSVVHYVLAARTLGQDDLMELIPDAEVA